MLEPKTYVVLIHNLITASNVSLIFVNNFALGSRKLRGFHYYIKYHLLSMKIINAEEICYCVLLTSSAVTM